MLAGAAGVGKTRLLRELIGTYTRGPVRLAVATTAAQQLPLGPFLSILEADPVKAAGASSLLSHALAELRDAAQTEDQLLAVDDAHLLDDMSGVLVQQLVLSGGRVVVTIRTGEVANDAITSLWKDGLADRLEIQALAHHDLDVLLETVLGGPCESSTVERIWRATGGNPMFVRELVSDALESASLRLRAGVWRLDGGLPVGPSLREHVQRRMAAIGRDVRDVLEPLALAEPLGTEMLGALASSEAVAAAEAASLIAWEDHSGRDLARLAHPLFGEAVREQMAPSRVRELYRRLVALDADRPSRSFEDLLRRAVWVFGSDAPVTPASAEDLVKGAQVAAQSRDFVLAESLARRAASVSTPHLFEARFALAQSARWQSRFEEADRIYTELFDEATTDLQRVRVLNVRAFGLQFLLHRSREAEAFLDLAAARIADPQMRCLIDAVRATFALYAGRTPSAAAQAAAVLAQPDAPRAAVQWAATTSMSAAASLGRAEVAAEAVRRLDHLEATQLQSPFERAVSELARHELLLMLGDVGVAEQRAAQYHAGIVGSFDFVDIPIGAFLRASAALEAGKPQSAIRWAREAVSQERISEIADFAARVGSVLAIAGVQCDDRTAIADGRAVIGVMPEIFPRCEPQALLAEGWAAGADGELTRARELALRAAARASDMSQPAMVLSAAHNALRFGSHEACDLIDHVASAVDGALAPLIARHSAAWRNHDAAELDDISVGFESLGLVLHAADCAAQAAKAHRESGRSSSALAAASRARSLQARCDNARTPALAECETPLPLTEREREAVTLAAAGLSNREIADRLVLNIRTVEGHLNRAFAKLGVANRRELARVLTPR